MELDELHASSSVVVNAPAEELYDMIADVTRMGEWSARCTGATWDDGDGPTTGSWFTGHNLGAENKPYDTRCQITDAVRPSTVAWMQGGKDTGLAEWRWTFTPADGGTEVTESWTVLRPFPPSMDDERLRGMRDRFTTNMAATLATLKDIVEA